MNDRIAIRGLRVRGKHGVFDFERRDGQDFVIDAVLDVDTVTAAASDDVAQTVDYGAVAAEIVAIVGGPPVNLIETLAERIAQRCLAQHKRVTCVEVTVHKPQAPIMVSVDPFPDAPVDNVRFAEAQFDDISVTIVRRRGDAGRP